MDKEGRPGDVEAGLQATPQERKHLWSQPQKQTSSNKTHWTWVPHWVKSVHTKKESKTVLTYKPGETGYPPWLLPVGSFTEHQSSTYHVQRARDFKRKERETACTLPEAYESAA